MVTRLTIVLIFSATCFGKNKNQSMVIQMDPDQIADTFKSVLSSQYLKEMANEFAVKAANDFIKIMEKKQLENSGYVVHRSPVKLSTRTPDHTNDDTVKYQELYSLIKEPAPDGDNLEKEVMLSEEAKKETPQKQFPKQKINGVYFKRFFL